MLKQFSKFFAVGLINTGVDFAVLNSLLIIFGATKSDSHYIVFKGISFLVAVVNSYLFNKYWTFASAGGVTQKVKAKNEPLLFFIISTIGLILNMVIANWIFTLILLLYPESMLIASNIGAIVASLVVLLFNFVGYKFIVFKNNE
jgi:putative flippase GtrA